MSAPKSSSKLRLAFSTNAFLKFSFAEAARRLAALGYTGIEIMADVPHAWPACLLEEQKEAIRRSAGASETTAGDQVPAVKH